METITMCNNTIPGAVPGILLQLKDGDHTFYHSTGIQALPDEATNNPDLREEVARHSLAMCKAYTLMQLRQMDMDGRIFEMEVSRVLSDSYVFVVRKSLHPLYPRLLRYIDEAHRDGAMGDGRYAVALGKAEKLRRFLVIIGRTSMQVREFTADMVLQFRQFLYNEYTYVPLYPDLYPRGSGHRPPKQRMRDTTVVHDLKLLQAFFAELENTREIRRSPFRSISVEKRRIMMHVMYDAPVFLRAEELRRVMMTQVPTELQWVKDLFVLNCAIGCRISDLLSLTMEKVSVADDGIPYVHYIASKTAKMQITNQEIITPLISPALEIIKQTRLKLMDGNPHYGKQLYNKVLRQLLQLCGINRQVCIFNHETGDNCYKPIYEVATSKLARKTHVDMMNKVQINYYAAGLHRAGSDAVFRYTNLELADRYTLICAAFGEKPCRVDKDLRVLTESKDAGSD